ncbi:MAG: dTDP-4-dehydrorhamnose reductase [Nitrospirae bacterium CG_4_9_14_3_um_filter_53_35]|nr:MAG: dTDP-4-dehydrorhamnose reductase [Nitrospirae bacterium CG2_30_53_67]PIS37226.1 MAG: dTDP-4-dehydrorhamnose reductase [Nitrospirae bacterium CG08_land_8_20_14_0_20_52_24]PIV83022.1 MAG: dTDP-4-dehydrorhamnose reductase [Nitrospirae bacterium CG17_big_fil_post_rev_8_21_14_2_50_50_9]PIW85086.1 MAG: dTDP-4-dehydrorhamnose reductase [Nitrospirae bacterium CG_4_8_14_3_um_filter_50_41]PIX85955.1 MAG: dTDP-4-dehydrorhamnose reductase [Nitrospirae bacterium CG_4_10_14_3_um_filter_53_41]PJA7603
MKTLALIGYKGMLGRDLLKRLEDSFKCIPADIGELDITQREQVLQWIGEVRPDVLINAAAYTDVDGCETRRDLAMRVNGEGVGYLAEGCARCGSGMIHISTDFVFDGSKKGPYIEEDQPNPLSVYGSSKLMGEKRMAEHLDRFLIVRTSWLFGHGGKNFVEAILRQAEVKSSLKVVHDQVGSPTYVPDLSRAILKLLSAGAAGIVHVGNSGSCSWFKFAGKILEYSGKRGVSVEPITSSELNRPARRPAHSVLSCERYFKITGERMPNWETGLKAYLKAGEE